MRLRERTQREQGFTLLEVTVVLLIVGILTAIATPNYLRAKQDTTDGTLIATMTSLNAKVGTFIATKKYVPESIAEAGAKKPNNISAAIISDGQDYCLLGVIKGGTYTRSNPFVVVNGNSQRESGVCSLDTSGAIWE